MQSLNSKKGFSLIEVLIVVVIIGLLAAMAIPAFNKVRQNTKAKHITENLNLIAKSGQQYLLENNASEVSYPALAGLYFEPLLPVAGEDYTPLIIFGPGTDHKLSVTQSDGTEIAIQY
ncbi:MAG: pilus assembly protein [Verrucomicrobia bacterium]|nr:MAG: pilus assembly protein [Verrucomicrobiota bacterium]